MNPLQAILGIGAGVLAVLVLKTVFGGSDLFLMQGGTRFWKKEQAGPLHKALMGLSATPHTMVADVWVLDPTAKAPAGSENALSLVKKIQASGSVVATSPNLLDEGSWPKTLAKVTAAQLMTFADKSAAILPAL